MQSIGKDSAAGNVATCAPQSIKGICRHERNRPRLPLNQCAARLDACRGPFAGWRRWRRNCAPQLSRPARCWAYARAMRGRP